MAPWGKSLSTAGPHGPGAGRTLDGRPESLVGGGRAVHTGGRTQGVWGSVVCFSGYRPSVLGEPSRRPSGGLCSYVPNQETWAHPGNVPGVQVLRSSTDVGTVRGRCQLAHRQASFTPSAVSHRETLVGAPVTHF